MLPFKPYDYSTIFTVTDFGLLRSRLTTETESFISGRFLEASWHFSHHSLPFELKFLRGTFILQLSGTGDPQRDSRIDSREAFAIETPIFIARQADSPESRR